MKSIKDIVWISEKMCDGEDTLNRASIPNVGRFTVLDRMTGFGYRDVETGFKDMECKFWLASGDKDVRKYPDMSIEDAVNWVKCHANNCVGI